MTRTSAVLGSPLYMSPEQMQSSRDVDSRSDIWALGVMLYELVAGTPPFAADSMPGLVLRVVQGGVPPSLRITRPEVPEGFERVILKCIEKDRNARYESVAELAIALAPFAPRRAQISVERISGVMRAAGFSGAATELPASLEGENGQGGAGTASSWGKTMSTRRRSTWLAAGVAAALVLGGTALWTRNKATIAIDIAAGAGAAGPIEKPIENAVPTQTLLRPPTSAAPVVVVAPSSIARAASSSPLLSASAPADRVPASPAVPRHSRQAGTRPPSPNPPARSSATIQPNIFDDRK
jgi:serine/threonine-protein kinase